ncbi:MAG TPA: DUF4129 domain-containing protein [Thermoplasmata archaeon]|nr:DUF4129 domain-containing protein [Thermoplasmata archaeon]
MSARRLSAPSIVLLVVLGCALAVGLAASALVAGGSVFGNANPFPSGHAGGLGPSDGSEIAAFVVVVLFFAFLGFLIYRWMTVPRNQIVGQVAVVGLTVILLAVLFVVVVHFLILPALGPGAPSTGGVAANNTTGNRTNPVGNQTVNGTSTGVSILGIPAWGVYGAIAVAGALAVAIGVPWLLRGSPRYRGGAGARRGAAEAEAALRTAAQDLAEGADPRTVIVVLYGQLLRRIGPVVGDVAAATPEEIRRRHLTRLGIRPEIAEALTRLFEEARYSTHPMGADAAAHARTVVAAAMDDLAGRAVAT